MNRSGLPLWGLPALLFLLGCSAAFGQGADLGSIQGVVTDAIGASVPAATVTNTDAATDARLNFQTNGAGEYEANGLR